MPKSKALPYEWYNTPNIRVLTIKDFRALCEENHIKVIEQYNYINRNGKSRSVHFSPNIFATNSLFLVTQG